MRLIQKLAPVAVVMVLALFGLSVCAGQPESEAAGGDAPALEGEAGDEAMPEGGEQGADEGEDAERAEGEESEGEGGEHGEGREGGEHEEGGEGGEHDEGGEHGEEGEGGEGEESGVYVARDETWDATRRGARLTLSFDPAANAFTGTVENTTQAMLCAVRVEVHLAGGIELGPTERTDLAAGESATLELATGGEEFETWTAHPEMSACG